MLGMENSETNNIPVQPNLNLKMNVDARRIFPTES